MILLHSKAVQAPAPPGCGRSAALACARNSGGYNCVAAAAGVSPGAAAALGRRSARVYPAVINFTRNRKALREAQSHKSDRGPRFWRAGSRRLVCALGLPADDLKVLCAALPPWNTEMRRGRETHPCTLAPQLRVRLWAQDPARKSVQVCGCAQCAMRRARAEHSMPKQAPPTRHASRSAASTETPGPGKL